MELRWSLPAAEDLEQICERIERDNPEAARRVAQIIYDGCTRLKDFANLGRASVRMPGRRELIFSPLPILQSIVSRNTQSRSRASSMERRTGHEKPAPPRRFYARRSLNPLDYP